VNTLRLSSFIVKTKKPCLEINLRTLWTLHRQDDVLLLNTESLTVWSLVVAKFTSSHPIIIVFCCTALGCVCAVQKCIIYQREILWGQKICQNRSKNMPKHRWKPVRINKSPYLQSTVSTSETDSTHKWKWRLKAAIRAGVCGWEASSHPKAHSWSPWPRRPLPRCRWRVLPTRMESDLWPSLSPEARLSAWSCRCAFPRRLLRWHCCSGCQRRSLKTWRTCGTWHRDPRGRVQRVRCGWPRRRRRCCCWSLALRVGYKISLGMHLRDASRKNLASFSGFVSIPGSGGVSAPSSPSQLKNTSKASWSEMSVRSIWSSKSTFTSMDETLPIGAAGEGGGSGGMMWCSQKGAQQSHSRLL